MNTMLNKELKDKAIKNFEELNKIVNEFNGSIKELHEKLNGFNFDNDYFDVFYGCLTATIEEIDGKFIIREDGTEVWNDKDNYMIGYYDEVKTANL